MKKINIFIWIIVIVLIVLIISFIPRDKEDTIEIGFIVPLSGPVAYTGEPVKEGFDLANNQNIDITYEDGKCETNEAVKAARKLIEVNDVKIIISGVCSGSTLGIAPIAEENKIILISPVAASPLLTQSGDYVFRIASSSDLMASSAAEIIKEHYNKIGILYEMNDYPVGWKNVFSNKFKELGGEILIEESFNTGDTDLRTQLIKINEKNPEVILITALSAPSAIQILKQVNELGIDKQLVGNEVFSFKSVINSNKEAAENMLVTTYDYDLDSEEMKKFLFDYKQKYGRDITEEIYGALGYDLFNLLYESIEFCEGDNPECIKNYLNNLEEIKGISGNYFLDDNGDAIREVVLRKIEGGKLVKQ